ncbi:MAG: amidohydrolase [SAR324 cluster bacterium]|nr:amidohydrolase [SAR324 cluster bacterium]
MIIDYHTHIFPDQVREHRETFFPGEPGFELLYRDSEKSNIVGVEELVRTMDEQGVDISIVFGFPWQRPETCRLHNNYVMEAVRRFPDRLLGLCCLDPFMRDPVPEIERCLAGGLSGVGELAFYDRGLDGEVLTALTPVMAFCLEKNLPVMLHTNEPIGHEYPGKAPITLRQIAELIKRFPKNKIILAHWGGGIFLYHLLKKELKGLLENIYFDTAASPFLYDNRIYKIAIEMIGVDRILFGSDFPLLKPERYFSEMEVSGLRAEQIAAICGLNAARLMNTEIK